MDQLSPSKTRANSLERAIFSPFKHTLSHLLLALFMAAFGWFAHVLTCSTNVNTINGFEDPPWWLEDTVDDFFSRMYVPGLPAVRKLNVSAYFTGMCGHYRFNESAMPTASVIVTTQNEQDGMLSLTVQTIIARSPPSLLKDIIIVDDNGLPPYRDAINETELEQLKLVSPKVKILTNAEREGVARCRMRGSKVATGDVLVFVDSHVEMLSATWLQHLLLPIIEKPKTIAAQTLDIINDLDWSYGPGSGDLLLGVISDKFWFSYQRSRFGGPDENGPEKEKPGRRLPYETPFAAGSLFAVRSDVFTELGGYDEGMYVWGGENTDFALKMWCCGGRVVMVPCSRVGHMYRQHIKDTGRWPPQLPQKLTDSLHLGQPGPFLVDGMPSSNFSKITTRNNIRVMERWAKHSTARTGYYKKVLGSETLPEEWKIFANEMKTDKYALQQQEVIDKNQCRDFDWFDKHVMVKYAGVHHPWHPATQGRTWI
ncbi:unnamed protein product [Agarophyton chilense]